MPLSTGQVVGRRFRIDARLNEGGMGAIYLAWDLRQGIQVVVKENLHLSDAGQRQFSREASILARLQHPSLPRVLGHIATSGGGQCLVMDYIEGQDLQQLLTQHGPVSEQHATAWISQVQRNPSKK